MMLVVVVVFQIERRICNQAGMIQSQLDASKSSAR
jgi:hypothetical protein